MDITQISKPIIFISHAHEDAPLAIGIKQCLEKYFLSGVKVFVSSDGQSIEGGDQWRQNIDLALRKAQLVIVIYTKFSKDRKWVYFESGGAYFLNARIIPLCTNGETKKTLESPLNIHQAYEYDSDSDIENLIKQVARYADLDVPNITVNEFRNCVEKRLGSVFNSTTSDGGSTTDENQTEISIKSDKIITSAPGNVLKAEQIAVVGSVYSEEGEYNKAIETLNEALLLDPKNFLAHNHLGYVYSNLGNFQKAIEYATKAIESDPENISGYHNRASYYTRIGKFDNAISDVKKALEKNNDYADAWNTWGMTLFYEGKNEEAIEKISTAINKDPKKFEFHNNLGNVLMNMEKDDEAIEEFRKALDIMKNPVSYNLQGTALTNLEKFDDAIACFEKAVEMNPKYGNAYLNWGVVLEAKGMKEKAFEKYKIAGKLIN